MISAKVTLILFFTSWISQPLLWFLFLLLIPPPKKKKKIVSISVKTERNEAVGHQNTEGQNEDLELPFLDLSTIASATDNFEINNKLGEGGFGPVYKVNLWCLVQNQWQMRKHCLAIFLQMIISGYTKGWTRNCCQETFNEF